MDHNQAHDDQTPTNMIIHRIDGFLMAEVHSVRDNGAERCARAPTSTDRFNKMTDMHLFRPPKYDFLPLTTMLNPNPLLHLESNVSSMCYPIEPPQKHHKITKCEFGMCSCTISNSTVWDDQIVKIQVFDDAGSESVVKICDRSKHDPIPEYVRNFLMVQQWKIHNFTFKGIFPHIHIIQIFTSVLRYQPWESDKD